MTPDLVEALAPLRTALLRRAMLDADRMLAEAERDAAAVIADAERHAEELDTRARAQGSADATAAERTERARARRAARAAELRAMTEAYDRLHAAVTDEVRRLVDRPDYPHLRERLAREARHVLGPGAVIRDAPGGGVLGRVHGARVDCSLDRLADQAVAALCTELDGLWTP